MLAYFLKVNVAIVLFYAFYRLFFYKDTFFGWRRIALLCFFAISAAVPLLNIQTWITEQEPMVVMADLYASMVLPEFVITTTATTDWKSIILEYASIVYWGIMALLILRFFIQLTGIIRLAYQCRKEQINGANFYLLPKAAGPFSFFHWIFINPSSHTEEELNEILTHEQTHARQWHSIDVIISELACILCWFNPFAWLMKREIRTNLEYMADAHVLENGYDSKTYQYHLLGLSHHKAAATIYNSFNVLPLKKRIKMMNKKRTKEIGRTKYLAFLPLAALLMIISNIEAVARTTKEIATEVVEAVDMPVVEKGTMNTNELSVVPEKMKRDSLINEGDNVVFEVVEHMPEFGNGGMAGLMEYLSKNIQYPADAHSKGVQGRVTVQFVVEKDGSISNTKVLRGVDPSLDREAVRVASTMPNWRPGIQKGQAVRVKYTVPIMFRLSDPKEDYKPVNEQPKEIVAVGYASKDPAPEIGTVFEVVEEMPQFPGGMEGLMQYLSRNIKYPVDAQKAGIQGKVIVQTIIDKDGNVTNTKIVQGTNTFLDAEAIRVTNAMPKWKAGKQRGQAVNVKYTFPIMFKLQ
ncbi:M56 family metallopeptidase [Bacteroides sp.]|uniref:M56 family metallopeptidase n=1 Tax=Bacteroides sp. TaxID=29523 RepID=UPI00262106E2|nr:M56 family metallopeptidase [Bacteroides sp.]